MNYDEIVFSADIRSQMLVQVLSWLPEEACGLLAGKEGRATLVLPVVNAEHSPVRFRMDPEQQLRAFLEIEERGLDIVGIYHSHPTGPSGPSATDLTEAAYPDVCQVIWSPRGEEWIARAYLLEAGKGREIRMIVESETDQPAGG